MLDLADAQKCVQFMFDRDAFSRWLGIRLVKIEPKRIELEMKVRKEMLNGFGVCHGGVTFAFADSALAFVSNTHGKVTVSIENSISYPAKVRLGDQLTAIAEELSCGRRIATYQVMVHNQENKRVGLFKGTVYRTEQPIIDPGED